MIKWLFTHKLGYILIHIFSTIVSISTIIVLCFNLTGLNGEVNPGTLFVLILNSLLLGIKTTTKISEIIMEYTIYVRKQERLSKLVPGFKEVLNSNKSNEEK